MRILPFLFFTLLFGCGKKFDQVRDEAPLFAKTGEAEKIYQPPQFTANKGLAEILAGEEMGIPSGTREAYVQRVYRDAITEFLNLKYKAYGKTTNTVEFNRDFNNIMAYVPLNFWNVREIYKDKNFVAVCKKSSKTGKKEILVDRNYWFERSSLRMALILHELGHCAQGLEHRDKSGNCRYIMEPTLITFYNKNTREILGKGLFASSISCIPSESLNSSLQFENLNADIQIKLPQ